MSDQIRTIETLAMNSWPAEVIQSLDGWQLRRDPVGSRRVNSVWPNQEKGVLSLEKKLSRVKAFYQSWGQPPRYQISPANLPPGLDRVLEAQGYTLVAKTAVQSASTTRILARAESKHRLTLEPVVSDIWLKTYGLGEGHQTEKLAQSQSVLGRIVERPIYITAELDSVPAAVGRGVLDGTWLGIFSMVTLPPFRRQGLAASVLYGLARWGAENGAEHIYLQVMENNPNAHALYRKAGFETLYHYHYRQLTDME